MSEAAMTAVKIEGFKRAFVRITVLTRLREGIQIEWHECIVNVIRIRVCP
ncbi:MAG: hypothetical protein XE10_1767, partial [Methanoculleus marisnigri]